MWSANPRICNVTLSLILSLNALTYSPSSFGAGAVTPPRPVNQQEYWARYDNEDWTAAIVEAQRMVDTARADTKQPVKLAEALTLLGNAQYSSGDRVSAEKTYREALQLIEQHAGAASAKMIEPLRGLGYSLANMERHHEAVPYLERALLIDRRNYGLYDMSQLGVLRQLADSLTKLGRAVDAQSHMLYVQRLGEQAYGKNDPRVVPYLCEVGGWYSQAGSFMPAREQFRTAIELVEDKLGKNDPALVLPLRALAQSYMQEVFLLTQGYQPTVERALPDLENTGTRLPNPKYIGSEGEKALLRALKILDARPDTSPVLLAETLIQYGDWLQLKDQSDKALPQYKRAASILASLNTQSPEIAAALSFPVRIYYPLPPLAMRNRQLSPEKIQEKFVEVEFTVTENGAVEDAKVVEQNGNPRQASEMLQAVRASRYRPKFVNGEPVDTHSVVSREVFKTRKQSGEENDS